MNQEGLLKVISGEDRSAGAAVLRSALAVAEPAYRVATSLRNRLYDRSVRRATKLPRPVISIGNLTTGGTGKTPLTLHLARRLLAVGARPAILTRGYRGGDEAREMQAALGPAVPVEANPSRAKGAQTILARTPATSVFLLDDGFQHRQIARDLDLVLLDATCPWGHGHVLPRGLMREAPEGLRRADGVILTRADQAPPGALTLIETRVEELAGRRPVARVGFVWSGFRQGDDAVEPLDAYRDRIVVLASGIGNPAALEAQARRHLTLLRHVALADHHAYTATELDALLTAAARDGASAVLTTEKDFVKWKPLLEENPPPLPVIRPVMDVQWLAGESTVEGMLEGAVHGAGKR